MDHKERFKKVVDEATEHINELGRKASNKINQTLKKMKFTGSVQEAYQKASYTYEIVGTADLIGRPYTIRGFLIADELELLIRIDEENQTYIRRNVALRDKADKSLIQIDYINRDEIVYVDLNVDDKVVQLACYVATYKAFNHDTFEKDVVKVEEDKVVGKVHMEKRR